MRTLLPFACALLLFGGLVGCDSDPVDVSRNADPLVRFETLEQTVTEAGTSSETHAFPVRLISASGPLDEDQEFAVVVVEAETDLPDGSYELLTSSISIPAGGNADTVRVQTNPETLDPGASGTVALALQPSSSGRVGVAQDYQQALLTVNARAAIVEVSPPRILAFSQNVAVQSSTRDSIVFSNSGDATEETVISNVQLSGSDAFAFIDAPAGSFTLVPGASASFVVEFDPEVEADSSGATVTFEASNRDEGAPFRNEISITGGSTDDNGSFTATLRALNAQQNFSGTARFTVSAGGTVSAEVDVAGLDSSDVHPQYLRAAAACPTIGSADANADGFVDALEGESAYGRILAPLDSDLGRFAEGDFPEADEAGGYAYTQSATYAPFQESIVGADSLEDGTPIAALEPYEALDLDGRTVVIHAVDPDTELPGSVSSFGGLPAAATLPVACGVIERQ